jgi:hypothetical protein
MLPPKHAEKGRRYMWADSLAFVLKRGLSCPTVMRRKYTYRVVFQGDRVVNQNCEIVLVQNSGIWLAGKHYLDCSTRRSMAKRMGGW